MKHIMIIATIWAFMLPTIFSFHIEDCGKTGLICYLKKKQTNIVSSENVNAFAH
jgi:hypothetical protein